MIKKTYIPGKPRNPKLGTATGTSGVGKTEFNQVAGSSHEHYNKGVLDRITEAMLVGALRDLITSTDTDTELTDENILSALRVLSEISKANADLLENIKSKFLSKIEPDTANKIITFLEGLEVGTFSSGALGSGAAIKMVNGTSYAEVDHLTVRQKATFRELIIEALKHIGGQLVLSPARMKCNKVVDGGTYYKCYFDTGDGEVSNEFVTGDQARCQVFTGSGTKFYWRLVTSVGADWINLSKTDAVVGSDVPEAGDDIVQLGNATDTTRQSAIILSTVGIDAPSWKQYSGINSFSLEGKETTVFSKLGNRIQGKTVFTSGGANLDDHLDGVAQDIIDALTAAQEAENKAQQAIEDAEANVTLINQETAKLQQQIDGEISNYYQPYKPTLSNYPASEWTTDLEKDRHIGDLFLNIQEYVDDETTPDAGKAWRFIKDGTTYLWTPIADSESVKAMKLASQAQATADGKSTTFLIQPTKYHLGDMWVLNSDITLNGIAYKQGDILTATQDSATYNQAHWLKRIRYTDDTAIDELEIGGRNLISTRLESWEAGNIRDGIPEPSTTILRTIDFYPIKQGQHYLSINREITNQVFFYTEEKVYLDMSHSNRISKRAILVPNDAKFFKMILRNYPQDGKLPIVTDLDLKFEKGNKATDWTPAPEDVQAEINTAKQEALNAASNAQSTANSLKDFTDTAFRDGIIDRSESVAIEKYKNSLNEAMSKAEASYDKVFKNTYLPGGTAKTSLLNAKVNLWGQRDTLLSAINTAISGGTTTPAQKTAVDNAFSTFNNLMTAFQNALEEANKAIQAKLDDLSTEKVENIEIGGRNLLLNSNFKTTSFNGWNNIYGTQQITENGYLKTYTQVAYAARIEKNFPFNEIGTFTFSIKVKTDIAISWDAWVGLEILNIKIEQIEDDFEIHSITFYNSNAGNKIIRGYQANAPIGTTTLIEWEQLEKGNKPTDWTPAPEDVEADIEAAKTEAESAAKAYADTKSEAERVLAEAYADGIVSDEEQTRIDDVNDKLAAAKAYADAQDALLKTQQEAYADGKISTAEQAAIDAAKDYADLKKTEAQAYADGIVSDEEARAIADAFEKYNASKAHAETLVENIEIGGRNLISTRLESWEAGNIRMVYLSLPTTILRTIDFYPIKQGQHYLSINREITNQVFFYTEEKVYLDMSHSNRISKRAILVPNDAKFLK